MKMITSFSSHKSGDKVIAQDIQNHILQAIAAVTIPIKRGSATNIRKQIIQCLHDFGWSDNVRLDSNSNINITSAYKQIGLCVQFGNYSRVYADLIKLQTLFLRGNIISGVLIVPSPHAARILGQNLANSGRIKKEVEIFNSVFTMPLLIADFEE